MRERAPRGTGAMTAMRPGSRWLLAWAASV